MTSIETPLWQQVLNKEAMIKLQIPDLATAEDFWRMYRQTPQEFVLVQQNLNRIGVPGLPILSELDVQTMIPDESWYLQQEHGRGIHGMQHEFRVGLYAQIIAHKLGLSADDRKILKAASLIHDIGRTQDFPEPTHGQQSVDRWRQLGDILKNHGIELDPREEYLVKAICVNHEKLYVNVGRTEEEAYYDKVSDDIKKDDRLDNLLKIFMAADALDRYRSPNEAWWPDPTFFHHDPKIEELFIALMPFARQFTLLSEYYRLSNVSLKLEDAFMYVMRIPELDLLDEIVK